MEVLIKILETPAEMAALEEVQRQVWVGGELEIVPAHLLIGAVHHGGLAIGAYIVTQDSPDPRLAGFVFGFPGMYRTPDGPRLMHYSHILGVYPEYRNQGIGFALKRAQWQMVRHQGVDRIVWTYDPLLSRNAQLNIVKLGAVCSTYRRNVYGELPDEMNRGQPTDRFQVDWWVNSQRVNRRLSKRARPPLDLAHFLAAGTGVVNSTRVGPDGWPRPATVNELPEPLAWDRQSGEGEAILLVEIPSDFLALKDADPGLAMEWRMQTRSLFEDLFSRGYLVTDFVHLPGTHPRSFYVLSHGESTL